MKIFLGFFFTVFSNVFNKKASPNYSKEVNETIINHVNEHSLQQCNNIPTSGNNILDLVFTTNNNLIENITVEDGISDHQAFIVSIKTKVKTDIAVGCVHSHDL
jgi:hypothetical protein